MRPVRDPSLLLFALTLFSCGEPAREAEPDGAPVVATETVTLAYDSMALAEDDEVFIGSPFSLVVTLDEADATRPREIWVSDFFTNTLLQFAGTGRFVRRLGGAGEGPHEFSTVGLLFLSEDEVGAVELRRREVKWFGRADGKFRRMSPFRTGAIGISPPVPFGDTLVFPLLDPITRTSIGVHRTAIGDDWTRTGPLPEPYRRSYETGRGGFASYFRYLYIDRFDARSILMAFSGVDSVYRFALADTHATVLGAVPRRTRRGLEGECRFAADAPNPATMLSKCGPPRARFSAISGAWMLPDGRIAVVHTDQHTEGEASRTVVTGTSYLTTLDLTTGKACVDMRIPGGSDSRAVYDMKGGALFIMDRRVTATRSTLWLLRVPMPAPADCSEHATATGWMVDRALSP